MLKRLYIDNFRCFVNFEYKPERKQLLLGANGSGKSSLLDAIRLLKTFVGARQDDFELRKTFLLNKTRWLNLPSQVFEIELEIAGAQYVYRLENDVTAQFLASGVGVESLRVDGSPVMEVVKGEATLYSESGDIIAKIGLDRTASALPIVSPNRKEAKVFVDWMTKELHCLRARPDLMSSTGKYDGRIHPFDDLSDIASWYMQLTGSDLEGVIKLMDALKEILTGFQYLKVNGLENGTGEMRGWFTSPGELISLGLADLSDGQRCLIALQMILLFLVSKGHTVLIDEPDNFISLREIQPWLLAAEAAVDDSKGQLILISHHPEILNQWAQEDGLRFFREGNGHVRTEKFKSDYEGLLQPSELIARGWENE